MEGKTYVRVQASGVNTYSTYAAGSNGQATVGVTLSWSFVNGITGLGWSDPRPVTYVPNDIDKTNEAIYNVYGGTVLTPNEYSKLYGCMVQ